MIGDLGLKNITGVMIAQNEEAYIARAITNIKDYVDEVIVLDGVSDDRTVEIATSLGARVISHPFDNHRDQKNRVIEAAKTDWVLLLDCDEYFEKSLLEMLQALIHNDDGIDAFDFPRRLLLGGQPAGDYPDQQTRLFRNYVRHAGHPHHHWAKEHSKKSIFVPDVHIIHEKSLYDQQKDNEIYYKTDPGAYKHPPLMRYIPLDAKLLPQWGTAWLTRNDYLKGYLLYLKSGQGLARHSHDCIEIWFVVGGSVIVEFNAADVIEFSAPAAVLVLSGVVHSCSAVSDGATVFIWKSGDAEDPEPIKVSYAECEK